MTPPRLVELKCPHCSGLHWEIDSDFRGIEGFDEGNAYESRENTCPACSRIDVGFLVLRQSPPAFLLQPHPMYPMSQSEFNFWLEILKSHFPEYPVPTLAAGNQRFSKLRAFFRI